MSSSTEIRVPRETVNDDMVTIAAWHVASGAKVRAKDIVVSIETSKAVLDVEAESDGYVHILHTAGKSVPVGELIGTINGSPTVSGSAGVGTSVPTGQPASTVSGTGPGTSVPTIQPPASSATTISKKAQALIAEHKLDPALFAGKGMVRESDVLEYLQHHNPTGVGTSVPTLQPTGLASSVANTHSTTPSTPPAKRGALFDARRSASDRGMGIFRLGLNYLWRNWFLGNLVRWAPRGIILPLHRMRGVKMGRDCFIDPIAIVETAFPENITLGNDVRITAGVVIMTHIKAPHYLRETGIMPVVLKPVVLEDHCFIGVNSVVMPGVTVGKAAVVASGSVVVSNVPPFTMVSGNPAKVIKKFPIPQEPSPSGRGQVAAGDSPWRGEG